jgi:hypothetical protein
MFGSGSTYDGLEFSGWLSSHLVIVFALVRSSVVMLARATPSPASGRSVVAMSGGVLALAGLVWSEKRK